MIPESYENEYSIWLILTAFEIFLGLYNLDLR